LLQRDASDNPRGVTFSRNIIPTKIIRAFDRKTNSFTVEIEGEAETDIAESSIAGTIPIANPDNPDPGDPDFPPIYIPLPTVPPYPHLPPSPPLPPPTPVPIIDCPDTMAGNGPFRTGFDKTWISGNPSTPERRSTKAWLACTLRGILANPSSCFEFDITCDNDEYNHMHVYGIDASGARLITDNGIGVDYYSGKHYWLRATFDTFAVAIAGFELEIEEGYAAGVAEWLEPPEHQTTAYTASPYGDEHAEITKASEMTLIANQATFQWGGNMYGILNHYAAIEEYTRVKVDYPYRPCKIWAFLRLMIYGGTVTLMAQGPLIPANIDIAGLYTKAGFINDNDSHQWYQVRTGPTLDTDLHVDGTLLLVAVSSTPVPYEAGLGSASASNVCIAI
jgi:hypothetical protein